MRDYTDDEARRLAGDVAKVEALVAQESDPELANLLRAVRDTGDTFAAASVSKGHGNGEVRYGALYLNAWSAAEIEAAGGEEDGCLWAYAYDIALSNSAVLHLVFLYDGAIVDVVGLFAHITTVEMVLALYGALQEHELRE